MGHDVVAHLALMRGGSVVVDVRYMRFHLLYLPVAYIQPQLLFALGKGYPQPAPCGKLEVIGKEPLHLLSGIPPAQGVFVKFVITHLFP